MNEDCGNLDQMTLFVAYCFTGQRSSLRPVGFKPQAGWQRQPGVTFIGRGPQHGDGLFRQPGDVQYRYAPLSARPKPRWPSARRPPPRPVSGLLLGRPRASRIRQLIASATQSETRVRVPHDRVGKVGYLALPVGAGASLPIGSSDQQPGRAGRASIADAIRFATGSATSIAAAASRLTREEECSDTGSNMAEPGTGPPL